MTLATFILIAALGVTKLWLDVRRNKLMGANKDATDRVAQAVRDASAAIRDLAGKVAGGEDVSAQLNGLADTLEAAVTASGEPTGTSETPTA